MKRVIFGLLFAAVLVGLPQSPALAWVTEVLDRLPSGGDGGESSSIAVDSTGAIHIASINQTLLFALQYTTNASGSWETIALDRVYEHSSTAIAVDSSGKVHICYVKGGVYTQLRYATNASGAWVTSNMNESYYLAWGTGPTASIAVDSADRVHIIYTEYNLPMFGEPYLKHAAKISGVWAIETVGQGYGDRNCIAVDSSDKLHISYISTVGLQGLLYATNASGVWVKETLVADNLTHHSIAVDSSNNIHICYSSMNSGNDLNHATNASGVWVTNVLGATGSSPSIVVDSSDGLHITYSGGGVQYATNRSGTWVTETVAGGWEPSIALDSSYKVHISYVTYDYLDPTLEYATNASGPWVTTSLPSPGDLGSGTSVALDDSERVHISYIDETNESLKYATNASGAWVTETVCPAARSGHTSIARDGSGKVHISHRGNDLEYTTNVSGAWVTETVDSSRGYFSSIALDSAGKIHISYGDSRYATNASGVWTTETVGEAFLVEGYPSIAVDSADQVHIAYVDATDRDARIVKYVRKVSDSWVTEIVDSVQASACSIVLDSTDKAHITYSAWSDDDVFLRYATNVSGAWVTATVEPGLYYSTVHAWIALDSSDKVYISYTGSSGPLPPFLGDAALKVANNASGRWETWVACDDPGSGKIGPIAVGPSGTVYVSHHGTSSLLLTSGIPPASSGWGLASTVESESRGASAAPNYLLFLAAPVGIILLRKALKGRRGLSR